MQQEFHLGLHYMYAPVLTKMVTDHEGEDNETSIKSSRGV